MTGVGFAMLIALAVGQTQPVNTPVSEYSPKGSWMAGNVVEGLKSVINWSDSGLAAAIVTPEKDIRLISREDQKLFPFAPWLEEDFHFVSGDIQPYNGKLSLDFIYDGALPPKGFTLQEFAAPLPAGQRYLVLVSKVNDHGRCQCLGLIPTEMKQLPTGSGARSDFLNGLCECLTEKSEKTFEEALRWLGTYRFCSPVYPDVQPYKNGFPAIRSNAPELDSQIAQKLESTASGLPKFRQLYVSLLAGEMGSPQMFGPFFSEIQQLSKTPKDIDPKVFFLGQPTGGWRLLTPDQSLALAKPYSGGPLYMYLLSGFVKGYFKKDQLKQVYLNSSTGTKVEQYSLLSWLADSLQTMSVYQHDANEHFSSDYPDGFMPEWLDPRSSIRDESGLRHKYDEYFGIKIKP